MPPKRKNRDSPQTPDMEVPDSTVKKPDLVMTSPKTPTAKRVRFPKSPELDDNGEGTSSALIPVDDASTQGPSEDAMLHSSLNYSPEIPSFTRPMNVRSGSGEVSGEGPSSLSAPLGNTNSQGSSLDVMDTTFGTPGDAPSGREENGGSSSSGPAVAQHSSNNRMNTSSGGPPYQSSSSSKSKDAQSGRWKGKEKEEVRTGEEEDRADDPDCFPICIHYKQSIFMMAQSNWSLAEFQQAIMLALTRHSIFHGELEMVGFGDLIVVWERVNLGFPFGTIIGPYNIREILAYLKRMRSDVVLVNWRLQPRPYWPV
ncbi:MAG: hypothetical protein Q9210_005205 [Variospora velana]